MASKKKADGTEEKKEVRIKVSPIAGVFVKFKDGKKALGFITNMALTREDGEWSEIVTRSFGESKADFLARVKAAFEAL